MCDFCVTHWWKWSTRKVSCSLLFLTFFPSKKLANTKYILFLFKPEELSLETSMTSAKSSSAEWPFSFCDVVNCSRKRHLTSALHFCLYSCTPCIISRHRNTNFPFYCNVENEFLNSFLSFLLATENISRDDSRCTMQFFYDRKTKGKSHQIDEFFLMIILDERILYNLL